MNTIILCGRPRSGTSITTRMLNRYPCIIMTVELMVFSSRRLDYVANRIREYSQLRIPDGNYLERQAFIDEVLGHKTLSTRRFLELVEKHKRPRVCWYGAKWSLGRNVRVRGFVHEPQCFEFVEELQQLWDTIPHLTRCVSSTDRQQMASLVGRQFNFQRLGYNRNALVLEDRCKVGKGSRHCEFFWWIDNGALMLVGADERLSVRLAEQADGVWEGYTCGKKRGYVRLMPCRVGSEANQLENTP